MDKLLYSSHLLKPRQEQLETIPIADWSNSGNTERTPFILLKQKLASDYTSGKKPHPPTETHFSFSAH